MLKVLTLAVMWLGWVWLLAALVCCVSRKPEHKDAAQ